MLIWFQYIATSPSSVVLIVPFALSHQQQKQQQQQQQQQFYGTAFTSGGRANVAKQ
jgi:hypothetical protein